jgi:hypothetical protein
VEADELELLTRSVRRATEEHTGADLDTALRDLGWSEAAAVDEASAVRILFENQGRSNASSSALTWVLGCDVIPQLRGCTQPASCATDGLLVDGLGFGTRDRLVVVADEMAYEISANELTATRVGGIDPALDLVRLAGHVPLREGHRIDWHGRVAVGQLALGHELVGAARAMLDLAVAHARQRVQFGQPIATFQAVRHRLADTLVAIEGADALLLAAWGDLAIAPLAKAFAGQASRTAARHCQQVLAGIGFTAEHPFHRYMRRTFVLDQMLGAGRGLTRQIGERVIGTRKLPAMIELGAIA